MFFLHHFSFHNFPLYLLSVVGRSQAGVELDELERRHTVSFIARCYGKHLSTPTHSKDSIVIDPTLSLQKADPPEPTERGFSAPDAPLVTLVPQGTFTLCSVSDVFLPLLKQVSMWQ